MGRPGIKVDPAEILELYRAGGSFRDIAELKGSSISAIRRVFLAAGGEPRNPSGRPRIELPDAEMSELYRSGYTLNEIAMRFGCSDVTVSNRLKELGTTLRPSCPVRAFSEEELRAQLAAGSARGDIADYFGASIHTVNNAIQRMNKNAKPAHSA